MTSNALAVCALNLSLSSLFPCALAFLRCFLVCAHQRFFSSLVLEEHYIETLNTSLNIFCVCERGREKLSGTHMWKLILWLSSTSSCNSHILLSKEEPYFALLNERRASLLPDTDGELAAFSFFQCCSNLAHWGKPPIPLSTAKEDLFSCSRVFCAYHISQCVNQQRWDQESRELSPSLRTHSCSAIH